MTPLRQRVFHLGRDLRIDSPDDQVIRLKLLQILAECLVRDLFVRQAFLTQYPEIS